MTDLSKKTAMVIDCGLFVDFAARLAKDFGKVYYYTPWESSFPKMNQGLIGYGIEGIERVDSPFGKHFDNVDIFVFPDVYFGPLQQHLANQGKVVWGCKMGEEIELYRDDAKKLQKHLGLPVGKYTVVKGCTNLRKYLKEHKNVHVKINMWRGSFETFKSVDYKSSEPKLDEIEYNLGAFKYITDFVVEDDLADRVEIGLDAYCIDGKFPSVLLTGLEIKDQCYVGKMNDYSSLPEVLTRFDKYISPVLKQYKYRGFYSTETRVGSDQIPYMIDFCSRMGSPPNELYQEIYTNLPEIVWEGAQGNIVDPKPLAKYGVEILIMSSWADQNWQPVDFPKDYRQYIKLRNAVYINNRYYIVPQEVGLPEIGAVIGLGSTMEEAMNMAKEIASSIQGYYITLPDDSLEDAEIEIDKLEQLGINYLK